MELINLLTREVKWGMEWEKKGEKRKTGEREKDKKWKR